MTEPVTSYQSKTVMLRAERGDTLVVGPNERKMSVIQRTDTYYGPKLILDEGEGASYLLTAPGPKHQLQLWRSVNDDEGFRLDWEPIMEVTAELVDQKAYDICRYCGQPIKDVEHERMTAMGIEHDAPEM